MSEKQSTNNTLSTVNRWLISIFTLLMVITAALGGNALLKGGSMEWLKTGHQHIGNLLFVLAVVQLVISYVLYTRKQISNGVMIGSALLMVMTFAQIGLGYSTRSHMVDIVGWHIALGVLIAATLGAITMLVWQRPSAAQQSR